MSVSIVDLYQKVLPKTNCGECGFPTCLAFASMVVSEKLPLGNCPHISPDLMNTYRRRLEDQQAEGKWLKKDMSKEALEWAKERAASMNLEDLPERIGGSLHNDGDRTHLRLPYFRDAINIFEDGVEHDDGSELNRWEQVFLYNHMAQGGRREPTGEWKALEEIPNTISKIKSMKEYVETPLIERFSGYCDELNAAGIAIGGINFQQSGPSADVVMYFRPLPRIPLLLLFWDADPEEGFDANVKLLFDETIVEHLDIESIIFLSERLGQLLISPEE